MSLLARAKSEPDRHVVVRGSSHENAANLGDGVLEELERELGGTQKGREELGGEMLEDAESATAKQAWIDAARRAMPERLVRRGIGIDPAITARSGSDRTGIIEAGLGVDGQAYVLQDLSGKHDPPTWAAIVLDTYARNGCDVIVVETNRGGALVTQNLRAAARDRGLSVVVLEPNQPTQRLASVVYVKEKHSRGPKEDRAQPIATAYERKRISHVLGADLSSLEVTLTTWEPSPGANSPDDLDALVHIAGELLSLTSSTPDPSAGFRGIGAAADALRSGSPPRSSLTTILGSAAGSGRI